ncbi:MAG TPA: HlyD family efflux transporter periplasmic adaptor subunit [Roseiarcus sp.]|nr:HlyD family efflux transporter periplasmic adaptor subunit [Roseiarcus sp.]
MSRQDTETPVPPAPSSKVEVGRNDGLSPSETALVPAPSTPPVAPKPPSPARRRSRWKAWALLALVIIGAGGGAYWWHTREGGLPLGIVSGAGRIEADEIDIDTKFAGSVAELVADEGDVVKAGQVVARMDTRDLEASLRKTEAQVQAAQRSLDEAHANAEQQKTQLTLAQQEFDRTNALVARGFATYQLLDQRRQALNGAQAALNAANDRVGVAERALDAATHDVELYKVNIADNTLVAPREGRIQYRIANVGEVLPAGGRVFTMLDPSYVYMDIYLPTQEVGKVRIGADARIVLDARPDLAIPAKVAFIAAQAQFTPKIVETKEDRDKLMFRVRVRIDPERLRGRAAAVRGGLSGTAYIRFNPATVWPPRLQASVAQ